MISIFWYCHLPHLPHAQQKAAGSARQVVWSHQVARSPVVQQPIPYGPDLCAPSRLVYPPSWVTTHTHTPDLQV